MKQLAGGTLASFLAMLTAFGLPSWAGIISAAPDAVISSPVSLVSGSGTCLATAGDINGDGFNDLAVGDGSSGSFTIYFGSAQGLSATNKQDFASPWIGFRHRMAAAGDVNGDGFDDFIVSNDYDRYPLYSWKNVTRLYLGSATGLTATPMREIIQPMLAYAQIGALGDINGDGYGDILVPEWELAPDTGEWLLKAGIFLGGPAGPSSTPSHMLFEEQPNTGFYGGFAPLGDRNGDGFDDFAIWSAMSHMYVEDGEEPPTRYWLWGYNGQAGATPCALASRMAGDSLTDYGFDNVLSGDINGDSVADLLFSAGGPIVSYRTASMDSLGRSWAVLTRPEDFPPDFSWVWRPDTERTYYGNSLALTDLNADTFADAVVSARQYKDGTEGVSQPSVGRVYVFMGGPCGLSDEPVWANKGNGTGFFGHALAGGDFNGDGAGDVAVIQRGSPVNATDPASVAIYYGKGQKPAFTLPDALEVKPGETVALDAVATQPYEDAVTVSALAIPAGATFEGTAFTWTPCEADCGAYQITFRATDGYRSSEKTVSVNVSNPSVDRPPRHSSPPVGLKHDLGCFVETLSR